MEIHCFFVQTTKATTNFAKLILRARFRKKMFSSRNGALYKHIAAKVIHHFDFYIFCHLKFVSVENCCYRQFKKLSEKRE